MEPKVILHLLHSGKMRKKRQSQAALAGHEAAWKAYKLVLLDIGKELLDVFCCQLPVGGIHVCLHLLGLKFQF